MRAKHFSRKALSPTASTSSTSRMGSSRREITEKAMRTFIPLDRCLYGVSTKSPMPANSMISSKL